MLTAFLKTIFTVWNFIIQDHKISNSDDLKDLFLKTNKILIGILISIIFFLIVSSVIPYWKDIESQNSSYKDIVFSVIIITCLFILWRTNVKLKTLSFFEKLVFEKLDEKINSCNRAIAFTNNILKHEYNHSYEFMKNHTNSSEVASYKDFIKEFKEKTMIAPKRLTDIVDLANESKNSQFLCVIRNESYLGEDDKDEAEIKEMVRYFAKFNKATSVNRNLVERIFTFPGENENGGLFKTEYLNEKKYKNFNILLYLITNAICSVSTYLLVYDKKNAEKSSFLLNTDYVIAYTNDHCSKDVATKLFFAYPEEENTEKNQTIETQDTFFIKIFEKDFKERKKCTVYDTSLANLVFFNKYNYYKILKMLNLEGSKPEINNKLDKLKEWISEDDTIENRKKIAKRVDEWTVS